ncbi:MarR family transcriptional regulator [Bacillus sp. FJAT-50079]|uniref:MarR family winged helix-turn-helix transcriptional regulator n=1 Tax=Bacillus sp. FJAT-50079 TaxID=2833577 RepID=UPI001BC95E1E|nr:MarR family transcriptional regulator [Bacillus sp. FJAT-50079]MBS4209986.1 MarR family transcriptional regulator [Bacillus sp. FJAT-50079]
MNKHSLEIIELEMAVLVRHLKSVTSNIGKLDRSAYLLLHKLFAEGPLGVKTLANKLQLDISTVSRQTSALEQKGYVEKIPDPQDGRSYFYRITDLGTLEWSKYKEARLDKLTKLLHEWSDEECENFGQLLKKFNHTFIGN